jgi:hypothetical protein
MSIEALNWVFGERQQGGRPGLKGPRGADRHVLLALANFADEDGDAWPSVETIAGMAAVSRATVQRALGWLVEHGYIERALQAAESKAQLRRQPRHRSNLYRLCWNVEAGPQPEAPAGPHLQVDGASSEAETGPHLRANGDVVPPSYETQGETLEKPPPALARTAGQEANAVLDAYFAWVKAQTGKHPSIKPQAMMAVLTPLFTVGWNRLEVKTALKAVHERGKVISRQNIEIELQGRAPQDRRTRAQRLGALRFDDDGNLIG